MILDHTYESIKALHGSGIYELRLDDVIGQQDNIRIVFFDPPMDWVPDPDNEKPLRVIWILEALQKKRDDWTQNQLDRFKASRLMLKKRMYN